MEAPDARSPFCHIVIPAPDLPKAKRFYEEVFGWEVKENEPGPGYWFFESGNVGGGLNRNRTPADSSIVLMLRVGNMAATLELIQRLGGSITRPRNAIGDADGGYDAYFLDPNGNELGLYSERERLVGKRIVFGISFRAAARNLGGGVPPFAPDASPAGSA